MTDKQTEALKLALEALKQEISVPGVYDRCSVENAITALREALAEQPAQQQEPVACKTLCELCVKRGYNFCANAAQITPISSTQPSKPWVGLTKEDKREIVQATERDDRGYVMALVEAKLREKNT